MFCIKCGSKIPDNSSFCIKCGANVRLAESYKDINRVLGKKDLYSNEVKKYILKNKKILLAISFMLFAIIGLFSLKSSGGKESDDWDINNMKTDTLQKSILNNIQSSEVYMKNDDYGENESVIPKEDNDNIPSLDKTSYFLGKPLENNGSIIGPEDGWAGNMRSIFYIYGSNLECYLDGNTLNDYYATENGVVVAYCSLVNMGSYSVKDFVGNDFEEPAIFRPDGDVSAVYLWKINDGYMSIKAAGAGPMDIPNKYVMSVSYFKKLDYFTILYSRESDQHEEGTLTNQPDSGCKTKKETKSVIPNKSKYQTAHCGVYAEALFEKMLNGSKERIYDEVDGRGTTLISIEEPTEKNHNAHYSIAGRGFSPIYDSNCIERDERTSSWYFESDGLFYRIQLSNISCYITYADNVEDLKHSNGKRCDCFMLIKPSKDKPNMVHEVKNDTEYLCKWSSTRNIDDYSWRMLRTEIMDYYPSMPAGKSVSQMVINEIYARHGYIFSTDEIAEYFFEKSWYVPKTGDMGEIGKTLNATEQQNIAFLNTVE